MFREELYKNIYDDTLRFVFNFIFMKGFRIRALHP